MRPVTDLGPSLLSPEAWSVPDRWNTERGHEVLKLFTLLMLTRALHDPSVSSSVKDPWMKDECNNAAVSDDGSKLKESVNIKAA